MKNLKGSFGIGLALLLSIPLIASADTVRVTTSSISPGMADVGQNKTYTLTITNNPTSSNNVGSIEVVLPSGFSAPSLNISGSSPSRTWVLGSTNGYVNGYNSTTGKIGIKATAGIAELDAGEYVSVDITTTAPVVTDSYEFTTAPWANLGFNGFSFSVDLQPTVIVVSGGAAEATVLANKTTANTGEVVNLTITLRDQYGNLVSDNTAVTLESSLGTIGGSGNSVNGVITRTLEATQAGTATLNISGLTMLGDTLIAFEEAPAPVVEDAPAPSQPNFIPSGRRNPPVTLGQVLGAFTSVFDDGAATTTVIATSTPILEIDPKILDELSHIFSELSKLLQQQIAVLQAASRL